MPFEILSLELIMVPDIDGESNQSMSVEVTVPGTALILC